MTILLLEIYRCFHQFSDMSQIALLWSLSYKAIFCNTVQRFLLLNNLQETMQWYGFLVGKIITSMKIRMFFLSINELQLTCPLETYSHVLRACAGRILHKICIDTQHYGPSMRSWNWLLLCTIDDESFLFYYSAILFDKSITQYSTK